MRSRDLIVKKEQDYGRPELRARWLRL
jgi:hypothetical protein